jgi:ADP-ribosyl-[dinitrogen reductase] hydrolase
MQRSLKPQVKAFIERQNAVIEQAADALEVSNHAFDCFTRTATFRDALLRCVAQGRASASAAALCGALAGAHYGIESIPSEWRAKLAEEPALRSLARHLQM